MTMPSSNKIYIIISNLVKSFNFFLNEVKIVTINNIPPVIIRSTYIDNLYIFRFHIKIILTLGKFWIYI